MTFPDPIAFATARLDEEERNARKARAQWPGSLTVDPGSRAVTAFLQRHHPGRELMEIEAGRRILSRHADCAPYGGGPCEHAGTMGEPPGPDLRDLLWRWSAYPGYQQGWLPDGCEAGTLTVLVESETNEEFKED